MKTNNWVTVSHVIPINHEIAVEISFLKYEKKEELRHCLLKKTQQSATTLGWRWCSGNELTGGSVVMVKYLGNHHVKCKSRQLVNSWFRAII